MVNDNLQKIAILGDTGAGKTCFIAVLQWLGEIGDSSFRNVGANGETKLYLDHLFDLLNKGQLPEGTSDTRSLSFSEKYVPKGRRAVTFDFEVQDYKGADLGKADDSSSLFHGWIDCDVLLVMVDVAKVRSGGVEFREILRNLRNVLTRPGMNAADKSFAIVLTQADKGGFSKEQHAPSDACAYIEENLGGFVQTVNEVGFKQWQCFALAALGVEPEKNENGIGCIPLSKDEDRPLINPFGYEELFDWLVDIRPKLAWKRTKIALQEKWRRWFRPVSMLLVLFVAIAVVTNSVLTYRRDKARQAATDPNKTPAEQGGATVGMDPDDRVCVIEEKIQEYEQELCPTNEDSEIRFAIKAQKPYWDTAKLTDAQLKRVHKLTVDAKHRLEDKLVESIKNFVCMESDKSDKSAWASINEYNDDDLIAKYRKDEVCDLQGILNSRESKRKKDVIENFFVGDTGNIQRMKQKIGMVEGFDKYPSDTDREEARYATKAMRRLVDNSRPFMIKKILVGTLNKSRREISVKIATNIQSGRDLKDVGEALYTTPKKDTVSGQWDGENEIKNSGITWRPGMSIRVEFRRNRLLGREKMYAYYECEKGDWLGFLKMLVPKCKMKYPAEHKNFSGTPWMTIVCDDFPEPQKALDLIMKYIEPGRYWNRNE